MAPPVKRKTFLTPLDTKKSKIASDVFILGYFIIFFFLFNQLHNYKLQFRYQNKEFKLLNIK